MIDLVNQAIAEGEVLFTKVIHFLEPYLKGLDPSLFQNIILGVLAIFIPFAIVFLADILNAKAEKRSEFEKMVLSGEVLGTKKVFWLSVFGIVFFSFFSGVDTPLLGKLLSVVVASALLFLLWRPFRKILRFSEGHKYEFGILFLKSLRFSRFLKFSNQSRAEKMLRAWKSFWSESLKINERDFTMVFIGHIDDAISTGRYDLAVNLSQVYVGDITKRSPFSVSHDILPKVFEWNEIFWDKQQHWLKLYETEKRIRDFFSQKHFPTFREWVLDAYQKLHSGRERFWNWRYFGGEFFQAAARVLLKREPFELFRVFKKHVEACEHKLAEIAEGAKKEIYWQYITGIFSSFCPTFFAEISNAQDKYDIWGHYFPSDWLITVQNKENRVPHILVNEFYKWSHGRLLRKPGAEDLDEGLIEVINGIFPNVHPTLFTVFLMLLSAGNVRDALESEPNFYVLGPIVSYSGSVDESGEARNKRVSDMLDAKALSQKEETIKIILGYFAPYWPVLKIVLNSDNAKQWEEASDAVRGKMLQQARLEKLQQIQEEIESNEMKTLYAASDQKESRRVAILELIRLLLSELATDKEKNHYLRT